MTKLDEYLYSEYQKNQANIKGRNYLGNETSKAYKRIQSTFQCTKEWTETMETIEAHQDEISFRFYEQGFRDGMRFMMGMVTQS